MAAMRDPGGMVDPHYLATRGIVPLGVEDDRAVFAVADPDDAATTVALAFAVRGPVVLRRAEADAAHVPATPSPSLFARTLGDGGDMAHWIAADEEARQAADAADATVLRAHAAGLRFEVERGIAVRQAMAMPAMTMILGFALLGPVAVVLALAGFAARDAVEAVRAARGVADDADAATARDRALLAIRLAGVRVAVPMLIGLALLLVARLD